jgi:CRP-like cAMP-binding protein
LLAALPQDIFGRLKPHLELHELPLGKLLYDVGETIGYVYFPTTAIISLAYVLASGASADMAVIGREGAAGMALFMGGDVALTRVLVQHTGHALRIRAGILEEEVHKNQRAFTAFMRVVQAIIMQIAHTAVCNRHHALEQQLCRLLLLVLDRTCGNELTMTQELLANMLGVRREGVTESAQKLQAAGVMRYMRGHITVLDRTGLETRACECYSAVKQAYDRLIPATAPGDAARAAPR